MDPQNDENLNEDDFRSLADNDFGVEEIEEETTELMEAHDIDQDTAERAREIMDEWGVDDEDVAVEMAEEGI
ncbi:MAG: hypothetical protein A2Y82_04775 [Candidatus Buchananbacteria bacterium RBG_13_36_9]|uniref:Uncharacterized protein n=1 Tax=Candidatus Buchananbacteria bacterium RBG_13_36_9 TaxID=1797530 RepID=A0A1G1XR61_9BACT|nr:MAG: hypothetical protein A2Y82_04775 [Candidatus Buchananbacteria bacterium RBG_13_36_9]